MKRKNNIRSILNPIHYLAHRRIVLFWAVAAIAITGPWLLPNITGAGEKKILENCDVLKVYDGDTITVSCQGEKIKVRLYCIDAPEMAQKPWGRKSRDYLRGITGSTVDLRAETKDKYGRLIAEVHSNSTNLNLSMIESGNAAVYQRFCGDPAYSSAQRSAQNQQRGVWGVAGSHQRPWDWRHR